MNHEQSTQGCQCSDCQIEQLRAEVDRLTNRVNDRDCEIERLREFNKNGPYDEQHAKEKQILRAEIEWLTAQLAKHGRGDDTQENP